MKEALLSLCKQFLVFATHWLYLQRRQTTPSILTRQAFLYHSLLTTLINGLIGNRKNTTSQHFFHLIVPELNRQRKGHRFYNITFL